MSITFFWHGIFWNVELLEVTTIWFNKYEYLPLITYASKALIIVSIASFLVEPYVISWKRKMILAL